MVSLPSPGPIFSKRALAAGDFIAFGFYKHGAQHASAGQAQSADKLGLLFVFDFGGAATLSFAVDGDDLVLIGFGGA